MILIGVDPGQETGYAEARDGVLTVVKTTSMLRAMALVKSTVDAAENCRVLVEDPREFRAFGSTANKAARRYGAGYVIAQRDAWEEFGALHGIKIYWVAPRCNITKLRSDRFRKITGWTGKTSVHGRDAAMLVWRTGGRSIASQSMGVDPYLGAYRGVMF